MQELLHVLNASGFYTAGFAAAKRSDRDHLCSLYCVVDSESRQPNVRISRTFSPGEKKRTAFIGVFHRMHVAISSRVRPPPFAWQHWT
jgi:hypothetical protein